MRERRDGESGVASVLVLTLACALVVISWGALSLVALLVAHREAQSAADLAALAAAANSADTDRGCGLAATVAAANKARLVSCQVDGTTVVVDVEVRVAGRTTEVHARARAGPG
ncbi:MAG: hypothetical protein NVSMB48_23800 [Marmoricola sp.]